MDQPDPQHDQCRSALASAAPGEARRRISIEDYRAPDYVPNEVLASLVRTRFGERNGILQVAAEKLYARLMKLTRRYVRKNDHAKFVTTASNSWLEDATSEIWTRLIADPEAVSFAEVRFRPWVEARAFDYIRKQLAKKNQVEYLETTFARKQSDDDEEASWDDFVGDDTGSPPEVMSAQQLSARLKSALLACTPIVRQAVYLRVQCEFEWQQIANILGCSVPTARKHYKMGMEALEGGAQ